ncbi:hypothetical protein ACLVWU_00205 [Bdellovibrio sp. HCB290]|uniref:hypothetical protein n=1 Tax=Bdellovibrio sp. HCB290 TaxID=3394356 RepID=UPI0039B5E43D
MELLNKSLLLFIASVFIAGCGVKGAPLPPLTPPPLGRGEPTYSEKTRKEKRKVRPTTQEQNEEAADSIGDAL